MQSEINGGIKLQDLRPSFTLHIRLSTLAIWFSRYLAIWLSSPAIPGTAHSQFRSKLQGLISDTDCHLSYSGNPRVPAVAHLSDDGAWRSESD